METKRTRRMDSRPRANPDGDSAGQPERALARVCDKYGLPHDVDVLEQHLVNNAALKHAADLSTIKLLASKLDMMRVEIDVLPHTEFGTPGCSSNYERERQCDSNFCHCNCYKSKLLATPHRCSVPDTLRIDAQTKAWPYVD